MKGPIKLLFAAVVVLVAMTGCHRRDKLIPKDKLANIYVDLFLADQWLTKNENYHKADTSFVYEPIFRRYGYTSDDYRHSMDHYIQDPEKYERILKKSMVRVEARLKELKAERDRRELLQKLRDAILAYSPEKIYYLTRVGNPYTFVEDSLAFYVDSAGGVWNFDPQVGMDTVFAGPQLLYEELDSVALAKRDSTAHVLDSLKKEKLLRQYVEIQ